MNSVKSRKWYENYGHKMGGMGYIHSDKTIPAHLVGQNYDMLFAEEKGSRVKFP